MVLGFRREENMFPKKCCCCIDLRLGTAVQAIIEIFIFGVLFIWSLGIATSVDYSTTLGEDGKQFDPLAFQCSMFVFVAVAAINVLTNIVLIFGIYQKRSKLIWQWFWVSITGVQFQFIVSCVVYWIYYNLSRVVSLWMVCGLFLILFAFHTYFGACVCGIVQLHSRENKRRSADFQRI